MIPSLESYLQCTVCVFYILDYVIIKSVQNIHHENKTIQKPLSRSTTKHWLAPVQYNNGKGGYDLRQELLAKRSWRGNFRGFLNTVHMMRVGSNEIHDKYARTNLCANTRPPTLQDGRKNSYMYCGTGRKLYESQWSAVCPGNQTAIGNFSGFLMSWMPTGTCWDQGPLYLSGRYRTR